MRDFDSIPDIAALATGAVGDELTFTYPEVLEVIRLSTINEIAVLGMEVFEVRANGYQTKKLSGYSYDAEIQRRLDQELQTHGWPEYVKATNALAEEFIRQFPTGDDHVYVLAAPSWREFCQNQKMKGR